MKLLDTSVAIDHLRGYTQATELLTGLLENGTSVLASELTRFELLAGMRPAEEAELEQFFNVVDWLPVTEAVTRRAGAYARAYRRSHAGIGAVDYLIAATAVAVEADLLTMNIRHFPMFAELEPPYRYS